MHAKHQVPRTNKEKSVQDLITFSGLRLEFDNEPDRIERWWKSISCVFPELRSHNILVLLEAINSSKEALMDIIEQQYHTTFTDNSVDSLQKLWIVPQSLQAELNKGMYQIIIHQTATQVTITILRKYLSNGHEIRDILNEDGLEYDICSIGIVSDDKKIAEGLLGNRYPGVKFNYEFL